MYTWLDVGMAWFRRFHRNKITVFADKQHNADIRTVCVFVELYAGVARIQKPYVFVSDSIDAQFLHISTFPEKEKRDRKTVSLLIAHAIFRSLFNGKGSPLF